MRVLSLLLIVPIVAGCSSLSYDGYDFERCQLLDEGRYYCEVSLQTFKKYSQDEDTVANAVTKKKFEGTDLCSNGYDIKLQHNVRTGALGYYWSVICH